MSRLEPCPIPVGWTIRVYDIPEKRGVGICATHVSGREIEEAIYSDPVIALPPEKLTPRDGVPLAFIWNQILERLRDQRPRALSSYDAECEQSRDIRGKSISMRGP